MLLLALQRRSYTDLVLGYLWLPSLNIAGCMNPFLKLVGRRALVQVPGLGTTLVADIGK